MFEVRATDKSTKARSGRLKTGHGLIETPAFMPVGTQGSVKAVSSRELRELNTQIVLGNTYHLFVRPGLDVIRHLDGLHSFMNWDGQIQTALGSDIVMVLDECPPWPCEYDYAARSAELTVRWARRCKEWKKENAE